MANSKYNKQNSKNKVLFIGVGIFIAFSLIILVINLSNGKSLEANDDGNVVVNISDTSSKGKYYTYNHNGTKMEFFVVKDNNGIVRMAFNRCQVCYNSGKGYFIQEGNEFVCQNCGNRYRIYSIGTEKGGCNPSPITNEDKIINGDEVEIKIRIFDENRYMFK